MHILRAIANGYTSIKQLRRATNVSNASLIQLIEELESRRLITHEGHIFRRLRLTPQGIDTLITYGYEPDITNTQTTAIQRQEIRHTSTFNTGFRLVFGAVLGFFVAWLLIGVISSVIYWLGYTFFIKGYVPTQLLPYLPFDNFLVDLILGLITSTALFLPLRRRMNLRSIIGD